MSKFYKLTQGSIPIIGCGGIASGSDAVEFARAGASAVQIYTAMGYEGPGIVTRVKREVGEILNGKDWQSIVGSDHA